MTKLTHSAVTRFVNGVPDPMGGSQIFCASREIRAADHSPESIAALAEAKTKLIDFFANAQPADFKQATNRQTGKAHTITPPEIAAITIRDKPNEPFAFEYGVFNADKVTAANISTFAMNDGILKKAGIESTPASSRANSVRSI